jgi:ABC-type molybdate transport system substrate-binding protein
MARRLPAQLAHSAIRPVVLRWIVAALVSAGLDRPTARADSSAPTGPHGASALLAFAAAALGDALSTVDADFTARMGIEVKASFAASAVLARQIGAGRPADVFFSADEEWMDYLEQCALLRGGSRRDLLGNALVLIAPRGSAALSTVPSSEAKRRVRSSSAQASCCSRPTIARSECTAGGQETIRTCRAESPRRPVAAPRACS